MKRTFPINPLVIVTLCAGAIGAGLQFWHRTTMDENMLLAPWHISQILLYVLTALTAAFLFLGTCAMEKAPVALRIKSAATARAGLFMGCLGLLVTNVFDLLKAPQGLDFVIAVLGITAGLLLFILGLKPGGKNAFWLLCGFTVYLILHAVGQARAWGTLPQLQRFLFPLLAQIFLVICMYYRCELSTRTAGCRSYVFFNQGALFLCCVCLASDGLPFYLGMAVYLACDLSSAALVKKEED